MRSKEVDGAINIIREFRKTGYCTLLLKCDNDRIRANTKIETSIETVLSYIETLEKLPNKIRDKIKELVKKLDEPNDDRWEKDDDVYYGKIKAQIQVLKSIIGE